MSENKEYVSRSDELGNIHISEEVLAAIAAAATLEVEGVHALSANLGRPGYYRVSVDAQGYRAKRADTLCGMARRMAEKVLKYHRAFALEPMSAYERRIVHAECQNIEGVTTYSVGEGADRKIVIAPQKD